MRFILDKSEDCYFCFRQNFHLASCSLFLHGSPYSSLHTIFDSILSKIDEVLPINTSANVFMFGDFNVHHHMVWLIYSHRTDKPGELSYKFYISSKYAQEVHFPTLVSEYYSPFHLLTLVSAPH